MDDAVFLKFSDGNTTKDFTPSQRKMFGKFKILLFIKLLQINRLLFSPLSEKGKTKQNLCLFLWSNSISVTEPSKNEAVITNIIMDQDYRTEE